MKLRLARLQQQQHQQQTKPHIIISDPLLHGCMSKNALPSPSPITPNSTDELLPSVDEAQEVQFAALCMCDIRIYQIFFPSFHRQNQS